MIDARIGCCARAVLLLLTTASLGACTCGGTITADSGAADSGGGLDSATLPDATVDAGGGTDGATSTDASACMGAGTLVVSYVDPCDCAPPPCCPTVTFNFDSPGCDDLLYLFCGDFAACDPPPIGWEQMNVMGGWDRIVSPGISAASGWECTPGAWTDPWINSVPMPPFGTVRAVALFDDTCGPGPGACTNACGTEWEVFSNPITVP